MAAANEDCQLTPDQQVGYTVIASEGEIRGDGVR